MTKFRIVVTLTGCGISNDKVIETRDWTKVQDTLQHYVDQ